MSVKGISWENRYRIRRVVTTIACEISLMSIKAPKNRMIMRKDVAAFYSVRYF